MKKSILFFLILFYLQNLVYSENKGYSITWGGHSTVLININGKKILTDPLLTNTVAGITKRVTGCKLNLDSIGKPDIILLSHSHFDHLCMNSLKILEEKFPGTNIVFPEGVEDYLPEMNFEMYRLKTSDNFKKTLIGGTITIEGIKITSVYAKHSGGRFGIDSYFWKDKSHTAFIIEYNGNTIFFSGDTGYDSTAYKKLGMLYDIDLGLIQTGPCIDCEGKGTEEHASSSEALNIFIDLKASYMIPVHYGSITYQNDAFYPVKILREIMNQKYKQLTAAGNNYKNESLLFQDRIIILEAGEKVYLTK
jgi:L-ascorbate metabolism protein UlaG (beta-lactamase superfamily)